MHGSNFADAGAADLQAIVAMGAALEGSGKPFVVTSGTAGLTPGRLVTEKDVLEPGGAGGPRVLSENAAIAMAGRGVRSSAIRLAAVRARRRRICTASSRA